MHMILIGLIVLYVSETWPFRKAEENRLNVFEWRVLGNIYSNCIDNYMREWRKQHNKELDKLFQRPNITNGIKKKKVDLSRVCLAENGVYSQNNHSREPGW